MTKYILFFTQIFSTHLLASSIFPKDENTQFEDFRGYQDIEPRGSISPRRGYRNAVNFDNSSGNINRKKIVKFHDTFENIPFLNDVAKESEAKEIAAKESVAKFNEFQKDIREIDWNKVHDLKYLELSPLLINSWIFPDYFEKFAESFPDLRGYVNSKIDKIIRNPFTVFNDFFSKHCTNNEAFQNIKSLFGDEFYQMDSEARKVFTGFKEIFEHKNRSAFSRFFSKPQKSFTLNIHSFLKKYYYSKETVASRQIPEVGRENMLGAAVKDGLYSPVFIRYLCNAYNYLNLSYEVDDDDNFEFGSFFRNTICENYVLDSTSLEKKDNLYSISFANFKNALVCVTIDLWTFRHAVINTWMQLMQNIESVNLYCKDHHDFCKNDLAKFLNIGNPTPFLDLQFAYSKKIVDTVKKDFPKQGPYDY